VTDCILFYYDVGHISKGSKYTVTEGILSVF